MPYVKAVCLAAEKRIGPLAQHRDGNGFFECGARLNRLLDIGSAAHEIQRSATGRMPDMREAPCDASQTQRRSVLHRLLENRNLRGLAFDFLHRRSPARAGQMARALASMRVI